jgi:predicted DNA-binding transcriptional regulator YafY
MVEELGVEQAYALARMENNERRRGKMADRRRMVIEALKINPALTVAEQAKRFRVSERTAKRDRQAVRAMLAKYEHCPICGDALHEKVDT